MFKRFRRMLPGTKGTEPGVVAPVIPAGFYAPLTAEALLSPEHRELRLRQVWDNNPMPRDVYDRMCLEPLSRLLLNTQNVPATREGRWSRAGGFCDLTVLYTTYAVRLARGYMFPPDATPEDQAAQAAVWHAVIFWSALFYHLPLLAHLEGELLSGRGWQPGISVPDEPFRFRFRKTAPQGTEAQQLAALTAGTLLPDGATAWLVTAPGALQNLAGALWHQHPGMALIRDVLQEAARQTESPLNTCAVTAPVTAEASADIRPADPVVTGSTDSVVAVTEVQPAEEVKTESVQTETEGGGESAGASEVPSAQQELTVQTAPVVTADDEAVSAAPADQDTAMLLSLFSADESETAEPENSIKSSADRDGQSDVPAVQGEQTSVIYPEGEADTEEVDFITWLKSGLSSGMIEINTPSARVHCIAGYVFLCVPDIFYLYQKMTGSRRDRRSVQALFERSRIHKIREGERFFSLHLYSVPDRTGSYKAVSGYLVKSRYLCGYNAVPGDSEYIAFP
ncbi:helicase [Escherichia coli]|uniref:TraI domain-containing protein n=1 Tax=Escherichia coli TaxID=562 RepID=UPI000DEBD344|nr:TraI domain-containing protein [Escherichia coli]RBW97402.1 helicase [Escherichia coli]RCZ37219.1 helicase [Escherichia coli]RCZ78094.1 helicase [Escherichia coli]HAN9336361.1 DNA-binding domain-containing protein [Escherichia coli]HEI0160769.1 TraI domain-containing protein [Escherichia coli]